MKQFEFIRQPTGFVYYFEMPMSKRTPFSSNLILHARRNNGVVETATINGFDSKNVPVYLIRATVVKTADEPGKRGRKPKSES